MMAFTDWLFRNATPALDVPYLFYSALSAPVKRSLVQPATGKQLGIWMTSQSLKIDRHSAGPFK